MNVTGMWDSFPRIYRADDRMDMMSGSVEPLANVPEFTRILTMFSNPILGLLAGTILTAIIQSSSASVGILQALCVTNAIG